VSGGTLGVTREPAGTRSMRLRVPRWSAPAWGAIGIAVVFVALSAWWLSIDRGVPYNDAALHLFVAFRFHDLLELGRVGSVFDFPSYYPPLTYLLGAAATFVAGVHVAVPILAQNLVYVPLLALACYRVGRMAAGPVCGLLAVAFALGCPLIIEQFHVFMLDMPQATFVALTVWLVLASDRFARVGLAGLAGLALGLGTASKELAPIYLLGLVACVLARGGWRNWRGLLAFGGVALAIGAPWYVHEAMLGDLGRLWRAAGPATVRPLARPPLVSLDNLLWYLWATLDGLLFAPLFALASVGVGAAVARVLRGARDGVTLELLCGLGGAWLGLLIMPHKDLRYTISLIVFLAVLGTAWIVRLAPRRRTIAVAFLSAAIVAAQLGATFGVGGETSRRLPGERDAPAGEGVPPRDTVIVYENHDFLVSGPHRSPDVLAFLRALRREGVLEVGFVDMVDSFDKHFEEIGLWDLSRVAGLQVEEPEHIVSPGPSQAIAIRTHPSGATGPPCLWLSDGSGVWLQIGGPPGSPPRYGCPRSE